MFEGAYLWNDKKSLHLKAQLRIFQPSYIDLHPYHPVNVHGDTERYVPIFDIVVQPQSDNVTRYKLKKE